MIAATKLGLIRYFARFQLRDSLEKNLDPLIKFAGENNIANIEAEAMLYKAAHLLETQRYREAMEVCTRAIELAHPLADRRLDGLCLLHKGSVLRTSQNDSKVPLPYFYQALDIFRAVGDTANVIRAALLISAGEQDESKQQQMLDLAEALSKHYRNENTRMSVLLFKSAHLPPDAAIPLLQEALKISRQLRIPNMIQHLYLQLNGRYLELKQFDSAIACVDQARAAFPNNLPDDGSLNYYEIYKEKGDFKSAIEAMERFRQYDDERKKTDMKSFVAEWETRLNSRENAWELQEQQKELKNQQTRNWLLAIILLLTVIAGAGALFAFYKQRKATELLTAQHETIRQQAEQLRLLETLKSRFFANVSHELRTPLTLILGPVQSLLKRGGQDHEEKNLLEFIQRNTLQLQKLINEILDLSKLEDNKMEVVEEPVHFYPYLQQQMAQFHSAALSNDLSFQLQFQADKALLLLLDKNKFEKIVHNFLSNALKFTPKDGEVILSVVETAGQLQLSVRDTGRGIHPDDLPHVFDRFYQSKQPDAPTEGGTGIGLSLVKELSELLGGTTWVESSLGQGSHFHFRFPMKPAGDVQSVADIDPALSGSVYKAAPRPGAVLPSPGPKLASSTLLLVEDNAELRDYLQMLLSDYQVLTAANGQEALQLLEAKEAEQRPDLIISDLMMPVMDGFQFLEKIKADDRWRHLPFLMLTAKVNFTTRLNALRIGVDDYLTKPFQEDELKIRLESLLHNYRERMKFFTKAGTTEAPGQERPVMAAVDAEWLREVEAVFLKHLADNRLRIDFAAGEIHLSERQFHRRIKQLTGLTPNQYLQEMRLQTAKDLLFAGKYATVKEVGFAVGYRDTPYFSAQFSGRFGALPSSYFR